MADIEVTLEQWEEQYRLVPNTFDPHASWDGAMFETYGEELEYVQALIPTNRVWTYCDGDEGELLIVSGYSYVNRIGYFVTEEPWTDHTTVIIEEN